MANLSQIKREQMLSFLEKLKFYRLFDAYTSINWCVLHNAIPSEYYSRNMTAIKKEFKR